MGMAAELNKCSFVPTRLYGQEIRCILKDAYFCYKNRYIFFVDHLFVRGQGVDRRSLFKVRFSYRLRNETPAF